MSLRIQINNKQEIVAGLEGKGSFSVIINYFNDGHNVQKVIMNISGIEASLNKRISWLKAHELDLNDMIQIKVSDSRNLTRPQLNELDMDNNQRRIEAYRKLEAELREEGLI